MSSMNSTLNELQTYDFGRHIRINNSLGIDRTNDDTLEERQQLTANLRRLAWMPNQLLEKTRINANSSL